MIPPLAIVQARMGSTRLPGKMLMDLGGKPLLAWAVDEAIVEFGASNVVVATTADAANAPLVEWCRRHEVQCFAWNGPEADVLGRFHACARTYRWHDDAIILRVTPDDWRKIRTRMREVTQGVRHPVEFGGEAFTLARLHRVATRADDPVAREHLSYAFFACPAPPAPPGPWTIDTLDDLEAARALLARNVEP